MKIKMNGYRRVSVGKGRAYLRQGFSGFPISEKKIKRGKTISGTKTRIVKIKHGKRTARANISETTIENVKRGFEKLVRMRKDKVPHQLRPLGFKIDRKRGKGYLFTLHRPGNNLKSTKYRKLSKDKKRAVIQAVIKSLKDIHSKGWIMRDRNPENIIFNFTRSGNIRITHLDPYTAGKFRGKEKHKKELMRRELRYVYDMLSRLR